MVTLSDYEKLEHKLAIKQADIDILPTMAEHQAALHQLAEAKQSIYDGNIERQYLRVDLQKAEAALAQRAGVPVAWLEITDGGEVIGVSLEADEKPPKGWTYVPLYRASFAPAPSDAVSAVEWKHLVEVARQEGFIAGQLGPQVTPGPSAPPARDENREIVKINAEPQATDSYGGKATGIRELPEPAAAAPLAERLRPCTCYPHDNPPRPCPQKFAISACLYAVLGQRDKMLADWAEEAIEDVAGWGVYADDYFKKKWDLDADIKKWKDRADKLRQKP